MFKFHKRHFYILDNYQQQSSNDGADQFRLKKFKLETSSSDSSGEGTDPTGDVTSYKLTYIATYSFADEDASTLSKHSLKNDDDCYFEVTDQCLFWSDKVFTFKDISNHNKNKQFFT